MTTKIFASGPSRRVVIAGAVAATVSACGGASGDSPGMGGATSTRPATEAAATPSPTSTASSAATSELPGGGRTIFPDYRLFGWCGSPGAPALGQLGVGELSTEVAAMLKAAPDFAGDRKVLPIMELIATIVQAAPGKDGLYRLRLSDDVIQQWLDVARANKSLLLLNIQPGRADFLTEAQAYEKWLREPDVELALDPEWSIGPGEVPGRVFGHTTGAVMDSVARWLSGLVQAHDLPEKALVIHVLRPSILTNEAALQQHPGVALIKSVDGIGIPKNKIKAYDKVLAGTPEYVKPGFKVFFHEDAATGPLMTPAQIMALTPVPDYVVYE